MWDDLKALDNARRQCLTLNCTDGLRGSGLRDVDTVLVLTEWLES